MTTLNTIQYLEDLPDVKQYQATFCITIEVSGEDEAEAISEAWATFEEKINTITTEDMDWVNNFSIQIQEL